MTPTEQLQAEAEQLYPDFPNKLDHNGFPYRDYTVEEVRNFQRAAHVACAEKYTAIIEQKNKEIERLREALHLISGFEARVGWNGEDPLNMLDKIRVTATNTLNNKPPTP